MSAAAHPSVGASPEIIREHICRHGCSDFGIVEKRCPCGKSVAMICTECAEPMFLAVEPGTWCKHAELFQREHLVVGP
jgi:hypothetical protein